MKIIVIIPAYNEEENICDVVNNLKAIAPEVDYIIVNDCSRDNTEEICRNEQFHYLSLPSNLGIGGGVQTGYRYALSKDYDIAVQMDGDGQHDPRYLRKLIEPLVNSEADIVIGSRYITREGFQSTGLRRLGITFLSKLIYLISGVRVRDVTSGYRAVNRRFIEVYSQNYPQDYPEPEAIVAAALRHGKIKEVPVIMRERQGGASSISSWKSIYYMVKVSISILIYKITFDKKAEN